MNNKIAIIVNSMWNILNFRYGLINALHNKGYRVHLIAPFDGTEKRFVAEGYKCHNLKIDRKNVNPLFELSLLFRIGKILKFIRPNALFGFTIKPNLYGSIASRFLRIPFIPNITGFGTLFLRKSVYYKLFVFIFRLAYRSCHKIMFQNLTDQSFYLDNHLVKTGQAILIPGSGINLTRYQPAHEKSAGTIRFLFTGRLIKDKGILELIKAAHMVIKRKPEIYFQLLGPRDKGNWGVIDEQELSALQADPHIVCLGETHDVRPYIAACDCVVLPSYREGLSRTLLEAAAMGKPIITTDVPGCREVVDDGVNGFLCRARDADDLAEKMIKMIKLSPEERITMGKRGREKVEREFDEKFVVNAYLDAIHEIFQTKKGKKK